MKVKVKKVYYCDFCKKHSLRPLIEHEKHCTGNPNRVCRLCGNTDISSIIPKFKITIPPEFIKKDEFGFSCMDGENKAKLDQMVEDKLREIREEVDNCPVCILTVIKCNMPYDHFISIKFDYKKELEDWWKVKNDEDLY